MEIRVITCNFHPSGFISVLEGVRQFDDLSHPICGNLREGNWMMDYTVQRLLPFDGAKQVGRRSQKNAGCVC